MKCLNCHHSLIINKLTDCVQLSVLLTNVHSIIKLSKYNFIKNVILGLMKV